MSASPGARTPGWAVHVRLGRVSNLPTVWTNVAAAMVLSGGRVEPGRLLALALAMSLFYVGGMYLNDAFDRHVDARERPERPIPSGLVAAPIVFATGFGLLALGIVVLLVVAVVRPGGSPNPWPVVSGVALAAAIVYYDVTHKRDPLSPVTMAACRALTYLTAGLAVTGRIGPALAGGAVVLFSYLIGVTYVAKQETLAEDRNVWPLGFLAAPFAYGAPMAASMATAALVYVALLSWVAYAVSLLGRRAPGGIPRAVVSLLAGISLLDALLMAGAGAPSMAVLGVVGFALTLALQRWVSGT